MPILTQQSAPRPRRARRRRGKAVVLAVLAVAAIGLGGAAWMLLNHDPSNDGSGPRDIRAVQRGRFDVVIPSTGELAALRQVEVVNILENRAVLTEIIPEGTVVQPGDVLFRIADDELRDRIKDAEDAVKTAEANLASAQSSLAVRESSAESDLDKAELQVQLGQLALDAWQRAEVVQTRQDLALALETAQINADRLEAKFKESEKLLADGHISKDEYERDRIEMIKSRADVDRAKMAIEVYESYQYFQDEAKKKSDLEQAQAERERVAQRNQAEINNARVSLASAQYKLQSAKERLEKLSRQLEACVVRAPAGGLVVYASSLESDRRGNDSRTMQAGTELRPNETVIVLPDTSQMIANVKVNEALTGRIKPGQRVNVISDALPNVPIAGEVMSVGVLAENGGWRDPNRRDYTVRVLLDAGKELGLKPSMRCKAEIVVDSVEDAIHIPIQAIFRKGPRAFVYVPEGSGYAQREVRVGRASELEVEVVAGLDEGEQVLLREPGPEEVVSRLEERADPPVREAARRNRGGAEFL